MKWRKLGRVYVADGKADWTQSHAYIPTPVVIDNRVIRVYCAFLDKEKVGRAGFVDLDVKNPLRIIKVSGVPILDIGNPGTFDDSGVTPISIIDNDGDRYMYYVGWQRGVRVRYFLFTGLAICKKGSGRFVRYSKTPVLDRSDTELYVRTAAHVVREGVRYKMWYAGGSRWITVERKEVPTYELRYIESADGLHWGNQGKICMGFSNDDEYGFGRPYVIKEDGIYKMWYSIRTISKGYRIGYAESADGLHWERKDNEAGIDVSDSGWDSEMICFASIIDAGGSRYMFYNGNNYGETGFGVAVLES